MSGVLISADNPRSIHAVELTANAASWGPCLNGVYRVPSQSRSGHFYRVTADTCECVDFQRGNECKHILAVRLFTELQKASRRLHLRVVA